MSNPVDAMTPIKKLKRTNHLIIHLDKMPNS